MNSKKVLSMLLVSLGAFSLALAGCNNKKNSDSNSAGTDSSKPSNSASGSGQSSPSTGTDSSTPSTGTDSSTPSTDEKPEATLYDVMFNYDDPKTSLTVWTDFDVSQSVAPYNVDSGRFYSEQNPDRRTVPLAYGQLCGMWYIAVDASGYIVYASYGTGAGYGSPSDDFYYNVSSKPVTDDAEFWSLHEQFATYGENNSKVTLDSQYVHLDTDGKQATTIDNFGAFDLLVPENGFIIKGHGEQSTFVDLCRQLRPDHITDAMSKIAPADVTQNGGNGDNFLGTTAPKSFDKFYLSIVEGENGSRKLSVRERTDDEKVDDTGWQEEDTYAQAFTPTEADAPVVYATVEDVNGLADAAAVEKLKGVVSYIGGNTVIIVDEDHNAVLVTDETATKDYAVGDTIVVNGTKTTTNGNLTVTSTSVSKIAGYGQLRPEEVTTVETVSEAKNVWKAENNFKVIRIVKAKVESIDATGTSTIKLVDEDADDAEKEFTMNLYKATFPDTVAVGDTIDVTCAIVCSDDVVQAITTADDILRYYNIEVDVDGDHGELEFDKDAHAKGDKVTLTPEAPNKDYKFSHWLKWNATESTWDQVSEDVDFEVEVGEEDAKYKAAFIYVPWENLPAHMGKTLDRSPLSANGGDTSFTVTTKTDAVFHSEKNWTKGEFDTTWRLFIIADSEGKIAYLLDMPGNGYGSPDKYGTDTGYYAHPDYADYKTNPAFKLGSNYPTDQTDFEIVVPKGGFIITAHSGNGRTEANELITAITDGQITAVDGNNCKTINTNCPVSPETRVYYDRDNDNVRVYVPSLRSGNYLVSLNQTSLTAKTDITVYTDDEKNPNVSKYDFAEGRHTFVNDGTENVVAVNSEGKIVYAASGLRGGYGSPADHFYSGNDAEGQPIVTEGSSATQSQIVGDFFALGPTYGSWAESQKNPALNYGDYETLVPEGGFVITGLRNSTLMKLLWAELFGKDLYNQINDGFNTAKSAGTFDNVRVELTHANGVSQVHVLVGTASHEDTTLSDKVEELKSLENYTEATYGTEETDVYSNVVITAENITVTAKHVASVAYVITDDDVVFSTSIAAVEDTGFTISVPTFDLLTHSYFLVQEWTIDETNYKSFVYHNPNEANVTFKTPQIGQSFVANVTNSGKSELVSAVWNEFKATWDVSFSLVQWGNVKFTYTDDVGSAKVLDFESTTFTGAVKATAGADWSRNLYWENEAPHTTFICCVDSSSYSISYNPTTNTVTVV